MSVLLNLFQQPSNLQISVIYSGDSKETIETLTPPKYLIIAKLYLLSNKKVKFFT
jgi:hypothetical protein